MHPYNSGDGSGLHTSNKLFKLGVIVVLLSSQVIQEEVHGTIGDLFTSDVSITHDSHETIDHTTAFAFEVGELCLGDTSNGSSDSTSAIVGFFQAFFCSVFHHFAERGTR